MVGRPRSEKGLSPLRAGWVRVSVIALAIIGLSKSTWAACPDFAAAVNYNAGTGPYWMVSGDFNRDGKRDLAVTNYGSANVSILLGNGNGTFAAATNYSVGPGPISLAIGDFNGDGKLDLAVANYNANNISILMGNGNGTFAAAANYAVGTSPLSIAVGDFDGDGKADLAVANYGSNNVSILMGNGDGTFAAAVGYGAGAAPTSVAIGDFNADGKADLAVADFSSSSVSVLVGNGDGTFAGSVGYGAGTNPYSVAVGDFNSDGKLDLAVANYGSGNISILLGNGNGTFSTASNFAAGTSLRSLAIGDFDGDGKADIAVTNYYSGSVSILVGSGTGSFAPALTYGAGSGPRSVVTADFNGDGRPDLAVVNSTAGTVSVLLNDGVCSVNCGTFGAPVLTGELFTGGPIYPGFLFVAAGDFDGDGKPELAAFTQYDSFNAWVWIFRTNVDGTVSAVPGNATAFASGVIYGLAVGDFNGDGRLDLALTNDTSWDLAKRVTFLPGNGDGTFGAPIESRVSVNGPEVAGDFNGDGKLDLAVATGTNVKVVLGNGDGTFAAPIDLSAASSFSWIAAGDFNRDGKLDLIVTNKASNNVSILIGNGDGTFGAAINYATATAPSSVVVGDFNADGSLDLAVTNTGSSNVSILLGNGNGTFRPAVSYAVAGSPDSVAAADFNADGKLDLVVVDVLHSGDVVGHRSILSGNGDGTFQPAVNYTGNYGDSNVLAADLNADGKPDFAILGSYVAVFLDTCSPADLTVSKTHDGTFTQGQTGATYTLTVTNVGPGPTTGTVTVVDTLPAGLIATAMSGGAWACNLGTLTCTRSDALAAGSSYPAITVTVNVASNAAASVTNTATVSGGAEINTGNDNASDPTTVNPSGLIAPTNLIATAASTSQVSVTWNAVTSAVSYQVFRSSNNSPFALVGPSPATNFTNFGLLPNTTYLYQVKAVDASGNVGPPSNIDLATTIVFTDDPLVARSTVVEAVHLTELRTAVNAVRAAAGLSAATFTDSAPAGVRIKAVHVTEMRSALDAALTPLGFSAGGYTDAAPTGLPVKAVHFQELRNRVK